MIALSQCHFLFPLTLKSNVVGSHWSYGLRPLQLGHCKLKVISPQIQFGGGFAEGKINLISVYMTNFRFTQYVIQISVYTLGHCKLLDFTLYSLRFQFTFSGFQLHFQSDSRFSFRFQFTFPLRFQFTLVLNFSLHSNLDFSLHSYFSLHTRSDFSLHSS